MNRKNSFIRLFIGSIDSKTSIERRTGIEHLVIDWNNKDIRSAISHLNNIKSGSAVISKHEDKKRIKDIIIGLLELRKSGTIKEVFDYCKVNNLIKIRPSLENILASLTRNIDDIQDEEEKKKAEKNAKFFNQLFDLQYEEIIHLFEYIQDQTVFSTKHGTKGEEYRNVLIVIDDTSWKSKYNFLKFISNSDTIDDRSIRTRNLFYVSCSRAIENLVVLSLSQMNEETMNIIKDWFGESNVHNEVNF